MSLKKYVQRIHYIFSKASQRTHSWLSWSCDILLIKRCNNEVQLQDPHSLNIKKYVCNRSYLLSIMIEGTTSTFQIDVGIKKLQKIVILFCLLILEALILKC